MSSAPTVPSRERVFGAPFLRLLASILERAPTLRGRRVDELRTRARKRHTRTSGVDFAGHRPYASGDDLRRVDWNLYARSRELHLTQREEDEHRGLTLLVDTSPSMQAGERGPRAAVTLRLAAVVAGLAMRRLDQVQVHTSPDRGRRFTAGPAALVQLLDWLADTEATSDTATPQQFVASVLRPARGSTGGSAAALSAAQGTLVWISDFVPPAAFDAALHRLRSARRRQPVVALLPTLPEDHGPRVGGYVELRDPESGRVLRARVDARLRRAMDGELRRLARAQDAMFRGAGVRFCRVALTGEDAGGLEEWLPGGWASWI